MMTNDDMDRLTKGLDSKAAKARALNEAGVSTGDISRYLGIRYQHVYNVLLRAGAIQKGEKAQTAPSFDFLGDAEIVTGRIDEHGAFVLPPEILARYQAMPGSTIYCQALAEGLLILNREAAQRAVTDAVREKMPQHAAFLDALFDQKPTNGKRKP
jgi:hypothetical protein